MEQEYWDICFARGPSPFFKYQITLFFFLIKITMAYEMKNGPTLPAIGVGYAYTTSEFSVTARHGPGECRLILKYQGTKHRSICFSLNQHPKKQVADRGNSQAQISCQECSIL